MYKLYMTFNIKTYILYNNIIKIVYRTLQQHIDNI